MIAVYYITFDVLRGRKGGSPTSTSSIYSVQVDDDDHHNFLKKLEEQGLPFPEAEVVFIENDKIISQWNPLK